MSRNHSECHSKCHSEWKSSLGRTGLLLGLLFGMRDQLAAQTAAPAGLPPGEGRDLVAVACTQCHALRPITMLRDGLAGWKNMVEEMVLRGAQLTPAEADTVARYLFQNFGPGPRPFATGALPANSAVSGGPVDARSISLPPGPGKDGVEARCSICHDLGRVLTVRRTREEWERITQNMIERGPQATPEQVHAIVSYLSSQFGK